MQMRTQKHPIQQVAVGSNMFGKGLKILSLGGVGALQCDMRGPRHAMNMCIRTHGKGSYNTIHVCVKGALAPFGSK